MPRLKAAIQTKGSCNTQEDRAAIDVTYTSVPQNETANAAQVLKAVTYC